VTLASVSGVVRDALGFAFTVVPGASALGDRVTELFAELPAGAEPKQAFRLDELGEHSWQRLEAVVAQVTLGAIAASEGQLLCHAGAVCRSSGDAAVICGPSGSGKTTLTVRLVESGLGYLTDETVCLDPATLRARPYRKPVSVKRGSQQLLGHLRPRTLSEGTWVVPPAAFDVTGLPNRRLVPQLLLFPHYTEGADLRVEPLGEGEAAFRLGQNSSRLRAVRGGALPALARLARRAPAYRLTYGDVDAAVRTVHELWDTA